jgi:hypothetical protein
MSVLKADTIQSTGGGAATLTKQHAGKAWINFDMTGTAGITKSFNISALVDAGTGQATNSFVSSFSDADYCQVLGGDYSKTGSANGIYLPTNVTLATGSLGTQTVSYNGVVTDTDYNTWALMGDLA